MNLPEGKVARPTCSTSPSQTSGRPCAASWPFLPRSRGHQKPAPRPPRIAPPHRPTYPWKIGNQRI